MSSYWFKPHTYGYGATPANWRGWAATATFALALLALSPLLLGWQPSSGSGPGALRIAVWLLAVSVLTGAFVGLARKKTDGQWGWRWGK